VPDWSLRDARRCHPGTLPPAVAPKLGFVAVAFDVDESPIAWRESGPVNVDPTTHNKRPILFLHGLGGSRISWEPQLASLGDERRCIAWDMPGYGASAPLEGDMTFGLLAMIVSHFAQWTLNGPVHLVGISFGGMIAQYVAARNPEVVSSLTLLSTSPKFGLDGTDPIEWRAARLGPLDAGMEPVDFADRVLGALAGPSISPEAFAEQRSAMARVAGAALRKSIDCLITHDSRAILKSIRVPTMCVVGDLDDETPVAYSQAIIDGITDAKLQVIAGGGHLLNAEMPDRVNGLIAAHCLAVEGGNQ
jgi:3-oxoadipate enol-lactonase